jgi:hypothetical protein
VFFRHCWNEGLKLPTLKIALSAVIDTLSTGRKLPIADLSMKELEGYIPVTIGIKKLRSLITPGRGRLI